MIRSASGRRSSAYAVQRLEVHKGLCADGQTAPEGSDFEMHTEHGQMRLHAVRANCELRIGAYPDSTSKDIARTQETNPWSLQRADTWLHIHMRAR
jgi:hypothetical protein